jgi:hypothetical protein
MKLNKASLNPEKREIMLIVINIHSGIDVESLLAHDQKTQIELRSK